MELVFLNGWIGFIFESFRGYGCRLVRRVFVLVYMKSFLLEV